MQIGFIGLGNMGSGMAASLIAAGHDVAAYNRSTGRVDALVAKGARRAHTVSDRGVPRRGRRVHDAGRR